MDSQYIVHSPVFILLVADISLIHRMTTQMIDGILYVALS